MSAGTIDYKRWSRWIAARPYTLRTIMHREPMRKSYGARERMNAWLKRQVNRGAIGVGWTCEDEQWFVTFFNPAKRPERIRDI